MVLVERVLFLKFADVIGVSFHSYLVDILLILKLQLYCNLSKFEFLKVGDVDCMLLTYEFDSFPRLYASSVFT